MSQQSPPQQPTMSERRKARQAMALRDNLKRRKARLRDTAPATELDLPQATSGADEPEAR